MDDLLLETGDHLLLETSDLLLLEQQAAAGGALLLRLVTEGLFVGSAD